MDMKYEAIKAPRTLEKIYMQKKKFPSRTAKFSDHSAVFWASRFKERFRMSRKFTSIVEEVTIHCAYFREKKDCTGRVVISLLLKCAFTIRQLTNGTVPDALDEYLQMGEATSRVSLEHFCTYIIEIFGPEYMRRHTITDIEKPIRFSQTKARVFKNARKS
ncbi:hypothetical protein Tco_0410847 [Tanacetum coccineum]